MISPDKIDEIKNANDIVDVISERLSLKKAGNNYKALCPFHPEKTPSFIVSPEKQIYHCFGCSAGGNVFTFIEKIENIPFIESVKFLAKKANIELDFVQNSQKQDLKEKFMEIYKEAMNFLKKNINENNEVINYIKNRQIDKATIDEFQLGYSLKQQASLYNVLKEKIKNDDAILKSGMCQRRENGIWDVFRGRLMFPILNVYGDIIAFGGRVLDDSLPKYINLKETEIYIKGKNLYNLNNARKYKEDYIVIVEGYMDAIALYRHGIKNVVATLGTALTQEQAKLIKRYVNKVILMYDMDDAGILGAVRGGEVLFTEGIECFVVHFEECKDPDDFIKKFGANALVENIKNSLPFLDFKLDYLAKKGDIKNVYYKEKVIKDFLPMLEKVDNIIVKNQGIKKIAEKLNLSDEIINAYFKKDTTRKITIEPSMPQEETMKERGIIMAEKMLLSIALSAFNKEDEYLILKHVISKKELMEISYEDFRHNLYAEILKKAEEYFKNGETEILKKIETDYIDKEEENKIIAELLAENEDKALDNAIKNKKKTESIIQIIDDCYAKINKEKINLQIIVLNDRIKEAETQNKLKELEDYLKQKQEFQKLLQQKRWEN